MYEKIVENRIHEMYTVKKNMGEAYLRGCVETFSIFFSEMYINHHLQKHLRNIRKIMKKIYMNKYPHSMYTSAIDLIKRFLAHIYTPKILPAITFFKEKARIGMQLFRISAQECSLRKR